MLLTDLTDCSVRYIGSWFAWSALALNTLGGILAGLSFSLYGWLRRKVTAWQFKQVFGPGVSQEGFALIYAELALRSPSAQHPYVKPGGNPSFGFSMSHPVPISEVRAANYVSAAIGAIVRKSPVLRSDVETQAVLDLDFVAFGGPESNLKTNDCQTNAGNTLAQFQQATNKFERLPGGAPIATFQAGFDYALILKVRPSQFPRRVWLVCAGLGEWGTSGAAWFLANKWNELRARARSGTFAAVIRVRPGQDQSAEIVTVLTA